MSIQQVQTAFSAGEISSQLWGNVDFAKMRVGASTLRNFYVDYRGGASSRAGTAFVGYSKQTVANIATGSITWSANPSNGDTVDYNGQTVTWVSGSPSGFQSEIFMTLAGTLSQGVNDLNNNSPFTGSADINVARYALNGTFTVILITYKTPGPAGNAYTISTTGSGVVSGATLTGGSLYAPPRLLPFQFNLNQGLMLEFGNFYMRVISQGAFVTETPIAITGATKADPCVITLSTVGLSSGDWLFISGVGGMTQLNGRTFVITMLNSTTASLQDVFGTNIDSTGYTTYTSGGTGARIYTLVTPYQSADLIFIKYTQSADVMSLVCRNQNTGTEYPPYDLARLSDDDWTLTQLNTGSSIAAPAGATGSATVVGTTQVGTLTTNTIYQYGITAVDMDTGEESVVSNIVTITNSVDISLTAGSIQLQWDAVTNAGTYNVYKAPAAYGVTAVPDGQLMGLAGQTYGLTFVDSNFTQDMTTVPPLHDNPFAPGALIGITITSEGSSLVGPIGFTTSGPGSGATGFGVLIGNSGSATMPLWVWTSGGSGYDGSSTITFFDAGGATATGDIVFSVNANNGDTITLGGTVWTFVTSGATTNQTDIGGSLGGTLVLLLNVGTPTNLQTSTDPNVSKCTYALNGGLTTLLITYKTAGTAGNSFTLAASVATPSGGTLTGGTGGTAPTGTLIIGPESGTYPSSVTYFQERRVYANTENQPDTYFMSQPGAFTNFDARVPTIDSDAIEGTPWSVQVDGIQFMLPILGGLVVLTGQTAYQVLGNGGSPTNPQPVTPTSQQALPQAYNGCHYYVAPQKIDYDVYYLQSKGSIIRSLSYNFWINVFTGVDITILSSQLFTNYQITQMTWCEEPYKVMWCVRDDGIMLSLTSLKAQDVNGWARHDTQGLFVSAASITEPPVDALYVATQRFINGQMPYMIERMDNRIWPDVESVWAVDCALQYPMGTVENGVIANAAVLTVSSANGLGQPIGVSGLVGGTNYSQATTVTVVDLAKNGTGCVVVPTITNGVIVSLSFTGGSGYLNPQLQAVDPNGTGTGFEGFVELDNSSIFKTDLPVFSSGMVGWVIRCGNGVAQITTYTNSTQVTAGIVSPITTVIPNTNPSVPAPFPSGSWTMTAPIGSVTGLQHLAGMAVTGLADGNPIFETVSADGTVTLPGAYTNVVIGLGFTAQLQSLYLNNPSTNPTIQGRRKKIGAVTVRLQNSGNVLLGTNQPDGSALSPQVVAPPWNALIGIEDGFGVGEPAYGTAVINGTAYNRPVPLFTGDARSRVTSGYKKPGQVAVQQTNPLPANILDLVPEADEGDTPETTPKTKRQQAQRARAA